MSTVIYPSPGIFGPVHSRRLGVSLNQSFPNHPTAEFVLSIVFIVSVVLLKTIVRRKITCP